MITNSLSNRGLQVAALEMETSNQLQDLDKTSRDAARQRKVALLEQAESALRSKADALMASAVIGGATRVAAGAATFASASAELDANQMKWNDAKQAEAAGKSPMPGDAVSPEQASLLRVANRSKIAAAGFEAASHVSDTVLQSVVTGFERADAKGRRLAEQEQTQVDDKSDAIRRRDDQFAKKLALVEQMLQSDHETARVIVRG
ncbi:MAG: hypothetical protein HYZ29_07055 [Myxococcales bacterium]|nr:hypothetical protein [Myxococcales bacterium]